MNVEHEKESQIQKCPLGVFHAPAFVADFPPIALEFHHRTHCVRLRNLGTIDKKSSRKIKYKKIPRVHLNTREENRKNGIPVVDQVWDTICSLEK